MTIAAVDDKTGADRLSLLSLAGVYALDDNRLGTTIDTVPGAQIVAPEAIVTTPRGELVKLRAGKPDLPPYGAYLGEVAATNTHFADNTKPTGYNSSRWVRGGGNSPPVVLINPVTPDVALRDVTDPVTGAYIFRALVDDGTLNGQVVDIKNTDTSENGDHGAAPNCTLVAGQDYTTSCYVVVKDFGNTTRLPHLGFTAGTPGISAVAVAGNRGTGTIGGLGVTNAALDGAHKVLLVSATAFSVTDPHGVALPDGTVGTPYSNGGISFTITAGGVDFVDGDLFTVTTVIGGGNTEFTNTTWARVSRTSHVRSGSVMEFSLPPGCRIQIILWQVETGRLATNPIACTDGAAGTRPERSFAITGVSRALTLPFTAYAEAWLNPADDVTRDLFSLTASGSGGSVLVTREFSFDNTLTLKVAGGAYTPLFRGVTGQGVLRTAMLVDDEVSRFSLGGLTKIDPFTDMPADLDTIHIGSGGVWLREFRIQEKARGDTLEAMTAPKVDSVAIDTARYVSAAGDDNADGKTPGTAWRTTDKVKAQFTTKVIGGGMHILFRRGDRGFAGFQEPHKDEHNNPVIELADKCVYGAYGEGDKPRFDVQGDYGFFAHGVDYAQWDSLDISQFMVRPIDLFGASGPMITDCVLGPTNAAATNASRTGLSIRGGNNADVISGKLNVYLAGNVIQGITAPSSGGAGDDVYIENMGGKVIYRGGHLGTATGSGADGLQVSSSPTAAVDLQYVYIDAPKSGKGGLAIEAGSFTLRDFDINGTNFCVTSSSSNTVIERGVVRGARLNSYSAGISLDNGEGISGHDYRISDVDIYNCNRGISISTAGGTGGSHFTGSINGTTLTVTAVADGIVALGGVLFAGGIVSGTTVVKQLTPPSPAPSGGVGTYQVSIAQTAASGPIFQAGPNRVDVFAERVRVFGCGEGLHVDLPTSGDVSGVRYVGCNRDTNVRTSVIPSGGVGYFKY